MAQESIRFDRVPPQDVDAERALLGAMIYGPEGNRENIKCAIDAGVIPEIFYGEKYQAVCTAIYNLYDKDIGVDLVTVAEELGEMGWLKKIDVGDLDALIDSTPSSVNLVYYAEIVQEKALLRAIIQCCVDLYTRAFDSDADEMPSLIKLHQESISNISELYGGTNGYKSPFKSIKELENQEFPETNWIIPEYLPEGLTILAGKPKSGKSFLALNWAIAVATGGKAMGYDIQKGAVAYLDLESYEKRLKNRTQKVLNFGSFPELFYYSFNTKRGATGLLDIEKWIISHNDARLVIIDTLRAFRSLTVGKNVNLYEKDTSDLDPIQKLAVKYGIAIVMIHHTTKVSPEDPFDSVSGTLGITGTADTIMVLKQDRTQADAVLMCRGREYEDGDIEVAMKFDMQFALWSVLGDASEFRASAERQEIVDLLKQNNNPLSPKEISDLLNKPPSNIRSLLHKLINNGDIYLAKYGKYGVK